MFSLANYYVSWGNLEKDLTNHIRVFEPSNDSDEKNRVTPKVHRYGSASLFGMESYKLFRKRE
jgi:hypothetical protein